jgi:hypothetical protein
VEVPWKEPADDRLQASSDAPIEPQPPTSQAQSYAAVAAGNPESTNNAGQQVNIQIPNFWLQRAKEATGIFAQYWPQSNFTCKSTHQAFTCSENWEDVDAMLNGEVYQKFKLLCASNIIIIKAPNNGKAHQRALVLMSGIGNAPIKSSVSQRTQTWNGTNKYVDTSAKLQSFPNVTPTTMFVIVPHVGRTIQDVTTDNSDVNKELVYVQNKDYSKMKYAPRKYYIELDSSLQFNPQHSTWCPLEGLTDSIYKKKRFTVKFESSTDACNAVDQVLHPLGVGTCRVGKYLRCQSREDISELFINGLHERLGITKFTIVPDQKLSSRSSKAESEVSDSTRSAVPPKTYAPSVILTHTCDVPVREAVIKFFCAQYNLQLKRTPKSFEHIFLEVKGTFPVGLENEGEELIIAKYYRLTRPIVPK